MRTFLIHIQVKPNGLNNLCAFPLKAQKPKIKWDARLKFGWADQWSAGLILWGKYVVSTLARAKNYTSRYTSSVKELKIIFLFIKWLAPYTVSIKVQSNLWKKEFSIFLKFKIQDPICIGQYRKTAWDTFCLVCLWMHG